MGLKRILLLAVVLISAQAKELFKPCAKNDYECLTALVQTFLTTTYSGQSEWGVKPTDPLFIPSIDIDAVKEGGLIFHYKNVIVHGFKNLQITEYKVNWETNLEYFKIKVDLLIGGDVEVELTKLQKSFKGPYTASATLVGTILYKFDIKDVDGKKYFTAGPETINSQVVGEPTVTVGNDLLAAINKDEEAVKLKPEWESNLIPIRDKVLTEIANNGFATIVDNLKAWANTFVTSAFVIE